jgi:hypothetical protein
MEKNMEWMNRWWAPSDPGEPQLKIEDINAS